MLEKLWSLQKIIYQELKNTKELTDIISEIYNSHPEETNFPYIVFNFEDIIFIPTKTDKKLSVKLVFKIYDSEKTNQNLLKIGFMLEQILPNINFVKTDIHISLIKILNVNFEEIKNKQMLSLSFNIIF